MIDLNLNFALIQVFSLFFTTQYILDTDPYSARFPYSFNITEFRLPLQNVGCIHGNESTSPRQRTELNRRR